MSRLLFIVLLLAGCGGDGDPPAAPPGRVTLTWDHPGTLSDGSPLDPQRDLERTDVFASWDNTFRDEDFPIASVGRDNEGRLPDNVDLSMIPYAAAGMHYSLKSAAPDGSTSGFAKSVQWREEQ